MIKTNKLRYLALAGLCCGPSFAADLKGIEPVKTRSNVAVSSSLSMQPLNPVFNGAPIFSEDFQGEVLPAGWVLVNVDGLTPNANVAIYTDAWIVREDNDAAGNWTASSTSWYTPVGQSDDWIITPAISILSNSTLSWRAQAPDSVYPDGYEVYVSTTTQDVAGCTLDPAVFTIAAEEAVFTAREVNLAAAGYTNDDVFICYRNNSNDQFVLHVDDITVIEVSAVNDVVLDAVAAVPEYTQVPDKLLGYDIPLSVDFSNPALGGQSNITVEAEILLDGMSLTTISQVYAGPLVSGASDSFDLASYTVTANGVYDVVYTLTLDGVADENPDDNTATVSAVTEITTDTMSRDDGQANTGALGVGGDNGGYLGNMYDLTTEVTVSGIQFIHNNDDCDVGNTEECSLDGETLKVDVFAMDEVTGKPGDLVGSSEDYVVPVGSAIGTVVDLAFPGNLNLAPGQYVFALTEPVRTVSTFGDGNVQLHTTENRYTPGTTWIDWPTNPLGPWANNEAFGFNTTYYMRPKFVETDLIFKDGFE